MPFYARIRNLFHWNTLLQVVELGRLICMMKWFNPEGLDDLLLLLEFHQDFILHILPLVILIMVLYNLSFVEVEPESRDQGSDHE